MRKYLGARSVAALAAAALIGLMVPGVADAAQGSADSASYTRCNSGGVELATAAEAVTVRTGPSVSAAVVTTAQKGTTWWCRGYAVGDRYNACGVTQANAWIYVFNNNYAGYSAMTCWN
ncbi:hypothetical protein ACGFRB_03830 [Streptomyces sp. NPDC048718]|uniref:hypothetical protein n=1 Tax=Streptomyces sp. NPDC048718 TaxID=3365587 RepID=UPI00371AF5F6